MPTFIPTKRFRSVVRAGLLLSFFCASSVCAAPWSRVVGCSIFDPAGKLLELRSGWICGFYPNGARLVGDGYTLSFYDKTGDLIWSRDIHTHHNFIWDPEERAYLVIATKLIDLHTRSDSVQMWSQDGKLLREFAFTDPAHFRPRPLRWDEWIFPKVTTEAMQIVSFYRIPRNVAGPPDLRPGHFIASEVDGRVFILDPQLKSITALKQLPQKLVGPVADVQVLPSGRILLYRHVDAPIASTRLEEVDLITEDVVWSAEVKSNGKSSSRHEGNIQVLPSGNILFSMVEDNFSGRHVTTEMSRGGRIISRVFQDGRTLLGRPNTVKQLNLESYFRHSQQQGQINLRGEFVLESPDKLTLSQMKPWDMLQRIAEVSPDRPEKIASLWNAAEAADSDLRKEIHSLAARWAGEHSPTEKRRIRKEITRLEEMRIDGQIQTLQRIADLTPKGHWVTEQIQRALLREHRRALFSK